MAIVVEFRKHTLLPLDDCLYTLFQATSPQLTRSSLHRCLERHGISRLRVGFARKLAVLAAVEDTRLVILRRRLINCLKVRT